MGLNKHKLAKASELYTTDAHLKLAFITGFDFHEEAVEKENKKYFWSAIGSTILIIGLSILIHFLDVKSAWLFPVSLITVALILVNAVSVSKWLGNSWMLIISFGFGFFCLFLGRGDTSFAAAKEIWLSFVKVEAGITTEQTQAVEEKQDDQDRYKK